MFCEYCGKDIGDAKFCRYCGRPVASDNGVTASIPPQPSSNPPQQTMSQQPPAPNEFLAHWKTSVPGTILGVIAYAIWNLLAVRGSMISDNGETLQNAGLLGIWTFLALFPILYLFIYKKRFTSKRKPDQTGSDGIQEQHAKPNFAISFMNALCGGAVLGPLMNWGYSRRKTGHIPHICMVCMILSMVLVLGTNLYLNYHGLPYSSSELGFSATLITNPKVSSGDDWVSLWTKDDAAGWYVQQQVDVQFSEGSSRKDNLELNDNYYSHPDESDFLKDFTFKTHEERTGNLPDGISWHIYTLVGDEGSDVEGQRHLVAVLPLDDGYYELHQLDWTEDEEYSNQRFDAFISSFRLL